MVSQLVFFQIIQADQSLHSSDLKKLKLDQYIMPTLDIPRVKHIA